jgi:phage terminase large subunit-like protein
MTTRTKDGTLLLIPPLASPTICALIRELQKLESGVKVWGVTEAEADDITRDLRTWLNSRYHKFEWILHADPEQVPPPENEPWTVWGLVGNKGAGKTRAIAEWVRARVWSGDAHRINVVTKSPLDVDELAFGPAGIMAVCPPSSRPSVAWELCQHPTVVLKWPNGAIARIYAADCHRGLGVSTCDTLWLERVDEWASMRSTWKQAFATLRGRDARCAIAMRPAAAPTVLELVAAAPGAGAYVRHVRGAR